MSEPTIVEVRNLYKSFTDVQAVNDVSFTFRSGEVHGFIGPNGAGKTTTMRMISTLEEPDRGEILMNGVSVVSYPERTRPLTGFMPDYLDSYPNMHVHEYLDFYARAYGLQPRRRQARINDVVEFVGLADMRQRPVEALSKGWKQRLSLARVLLSDPRVLILDEPAAGVDPRARIELRKLVRLLADSGKAILISSHILTDLAELCEAVTIIEQGKIMATGSVDNLQKIVDHGHRVEVHILEHTDQERARLELFLSETSGIGHVHPLITGASFSFDGNREFKVELLKRLIENKFSITDFHAATSDLEDAFIVLTGHGEEEAEKGKQ
jgi:ABC-2 type transport system ATP-binding protein